jgi:hypothetical protein
MATATKTYTFTNGSTILAAEHNTNFDDLVSFLNGSVVQVDGSKAMSGALAMGSNKITGLATPTVDTDAATRKYADHGTIVWATALDVDVAVTTTGHRYYLPFGVKFTEVEASVSVAPTDADLIVDVEVDGTTVFTTPSNRPAIAASGFVDSQTTIEDDTHTDGQYVQVFVDQVGSTIAGQNLLVVARFERT